MAAKKRSADATPPVRVAIVGSGMAGLVTAYLLHRDPRRRYAVKVFESGNTLSLDSASVSIPNASKTSSDRVDLPMRAFAGGYYNNLKAMYDHLNVKYHSQPFLFEFSRPHPQHAGESRDGRASSYYVHASNLHEVLPPRPHGATAVSYFAEVVYLLVCYTWFSICCFLVAPRDKEQRSETLDQYLKRVRVPDYFTNYYILPLISSVATCPHRSLLEFPASDIINYKRRTHGAPHYTVSNGVNTVQERLVRGIDYEVSAPVSKITPYGGRVRVSWKKTVGEKTSCFEEVYDKVILAVAPNIVGDIFRPVEHYMQKIPVTTVESVVHTDRTAFELGGATDGRNSRKGAQLIYLRTGVDGIHQTESHHVQRCGAVVTTCPFNSIETGRKIHSAKFTRVLRSPESKRIVNAIFEDTLQIPEGGKSRSLWRNGDDNVWLVGGWCWDGMVLLEGCVISAMRVAHALNVDVPWGR